MSGQIPEEHRQQAPATVRCAVVTVSDTRTLQTDSGGQTAVDLLAAAGHPVTAREIIPDEPERMRELLASLCRRDDVDAILMTGGTGLGQPGPDLRDGQPSAGQTLARLWRVVPHAQLPADWRGRDAQPGDWRPDRPHGAVDDARFTGGSAIGH